MQQRWVDASARAYLAPEVFEFKQRVKWFKQCIKALLRETGMKAAMAICRPESDVVQAFVTAISLPWDRRALAEVEQWLAKSLATPCTRDAGALASLPLAAQSGTMRVA